MPWWPFSSTPQPANAGPKNDEESKGQDAPLEGKDLEKVARNLCLHIFDQNGNLVKRMLDRYNDFTIKIVMSQPIGRIQRTKDKKTETKNQKPDEPETNEKEKTKADKQKNIEYIYVYDTPLNYALITGNEQIFQHLIGKQIIKDTILEQSKDTSEGLAPIHAAAQNPDPKVLQLLIEIIDNIEQKTKAGNRALHYACCKGRKENVDLLLKNGAEFDVCNSSSEYPLHWAAFGGDVKTFDTIFEKYAEPGLKEYKVQLKKAKEEILNEIKIQENLDKKKMDEKEINVQQKARERVEKSLNKKFGEDCLKKEAVELGVPLLFAAKEHQYDCIGAIFDHQMEADGTVRDDECDTALHFISDDANKKKLIKHFSKILKANALLGVKNEVGNTPLDWIEHDTMKAILDEHINKIVFQPSTINVSEKDRYAILFTNLFGHHASGSDIQNILALAQSKNHQDLSLHPVCQSILSAKWQKMKKYFLIKLLFFIPFVLLLSIYPILLNDREKQPSNETETIERMNLEINVTWHILYVLFLIQIVFGTLSVIVLISPFWKETNTYMAHWSIPRLMRLAEYYYRQLIWSDWYEYILWVMAFLLLHDWISPVPVVLVSWFALFLVCSNHPSILPFRYILVKILFRYIKFLIFAFGLISGFAMGFFLVLLECKAQDGTPCVNGAFTSIYTTALKIPSMMMGEIDFAGFSIDHRESPHVYILFGAFIFLITMCLFNMMNGLAINITQEMMQKAHIFKTIAQCDRIYEFEILLKEMTGWLKWFGFKEVNFLTPLWVERLKASPNTGKCLNLDEYDESKHGDIKKLEKECLWETNKFVKAKWIWVDRGYVLDRKIIYEANALISKLEEEEDKAELEAMDDEEKAKIKKKEQEEKKKKFVRKVIYKDPAEEEMCSEDEDNGASDLKPALMKQDSVLAIERKPSVVLMDEKNSHPTSQELKSKTTPAHKEKPESETTPQKQKTTPAQKKDPDSKNASQEPQAPSAQKKQPDSKDATQKPLTTPAQMKDPASKDAPQKSQDTPAHKKDPDSKNASQEPQAPSAQKKQPDSKDATQKPLTTPAQKKDPASKDAPQKSQDTPAHKKDPESKDASQEPQAPPAQKKQPDSKDATQKSQDTPAHKKDPESKDASQEPQAPPAQKKQPDSKDAPQKPLTTPAQKKDPASKDAPQKSQDTPAHKKDPASKDASQKSQDTPAQKKQPDSKDAPQKSQTSSAQKKQPDSKDKDTSQKPEATSTQKKKPDTKEVSKKPQDTSADNQELESEDASQESDMLLPKK